MQEIDNLTRRVADLNNAVDFWNRWMLIGLAATALAAIWLVFSTRLVIVRQKQLSIAQGALDSAKDRQLQADLKEKDRQIAVAGAGSAQALEQAKNAEAHLADANARASEANERAAKAEAQIASADAASKDAVAKVSAAEAQIAEANRAAAEANATAEKERLARLQLEARLADRTLSPDGKKALGSIASSLPKGTRVDFLVFGQALEAANLAQSIRQCLVAAGMVGRVWNAVGGGSVGGVLIGIRPKADSTIAQAGSDIAATLNASAIASQVWNWSDLPLDGPRVGPADPLDAPIVILVGGK